MRASDDLFYVTGGASKSRGTFRMVPAMWSRPVVEMAEGGAALGAAIAGACALLRAEGQPTDAGAFSGKKR
jgi:sugar (pentulose or hexulose) kinase